MTNWNDPIIRWNQLPATEVKRLIATWGKDEKFIAKYDKTHGLAHTPLASKTAPVPAKAKVAKTVKVTVPTKFAQEVLGAKITAKVVRQKHTGADGEIKFVDHRNLYVGFFGGKVVVTKRTKEQCQEVLRKDYKLEV